MCFSATSSSCKFKPARALYLFNRTNFRIIRTYSVITPISWISTIGLAVQCPGRTESDSIGCPPSPIGLWRFGKNTCKKNPKNIEIKFDFFFRF